MENKKCSRCKNIGEFGKHKSRKDGLQSVCKKCKRKIHENFIKNNPKYLLKRNRIRRGKARRLIYEYLSSHPCVDCGEQDPIVLQFDHINDKRYTISKMRSHSMSTIQKEISKCEVRCANCHQRKTAIEQGWYSEHTVIKHIAPVAQLAEQPD